MKIVDRIVKSLLGRWMGFQRWQNCVRVNLERLTCEGHILFDSSVRFRVPIWFRGTCGVIKIGKNTVFGHLRCTPWGGCVIQARQQGSSVIIGANCQFANRVTIIANKKIEIGDGLLCGEDVKIIDSDFHPIDPFIRKQGCGATNPVKIGCNVWIGDGVRVLKGVVIGDECVVAAGSIVARNVPPRTLVGGIPARWIKNI